MLICLQQAATDQATRETLLVLLRMVYSCDDTQVFDIIGAIAVNPCESLSLLTVSQASICTAIKPIDLRESKGFSPTTANDGHEEERVSKAI
jgi:hypothetical protein